MNTTANTTAGTETTGRPDFLGATTIGDAIAFRLVRIDPATDRVARDADGAPIYDEHTGTVTTFDRDNTHRPHPVIRFTLDTTGARVFTARPDFHITATR